MINLFLFSLFFVLNRHANEDIGRRHYYRFACPKRSCHDDDDDCFFRTSSFVPFENEKLM